MATRRRNIAPVALAAALLVSGCYTQLRTGPPESPPESQWAPEPPPQAAAPPAEPGGEPIDGEYTGSSIVVDRSGHTTGRIRIAFNDQVYRYEGDEFESGSGVYTLLQGQVVLRPDDVSLSSADPTHVLRGVFEVHRNEDGMQLVRREEARGLYIELALRRESDAGY